MKMKIETSPTVIESDALRANLLETAENVVIDPDLMLLLDMMKKFKGLYSSLESLLYEICHPFRNWSLILPLYRSFVLKNTGHFIRHQEGPRAIELFAHLFFQAIADSEKNATLLSLIIEAKIAWIEKTIGLLEGNDLERFEKSLNHIFTMMREFEKGDDPALMHIVQGQHPMI